MTLINLLVSHHRLTARWIEARGLKPPRPTIEPSSRCPAPTRDYFRPIGKPRKKAKPKKLSGGSGHGHSRNCRCNPDLAALRELREEPADPNGGLLKRDAPPVPDSRVKIDCPAAWRLPREVVCAECGQEFSLTDAGSLQHKPGCPIAVASVNRSRRKRKMILGWTNERVPDKQKELVLKPPPPPAWPLKYPKFNRSRAKKLERARRYYARERQ